MEDFQIGDEHDLLSNARAQSLWSFLRNGFILGYPMPFTLFVAMNPVDISLTGWSGRLILSGLVFLWFVLSFQFGRRHRKWIPGIALLCTWMAFVSLAMLMCWLDPVDLRHYEDLSP